MFRCYYPSSFGVLQEAGSDRSSRDVGNVLQSTVRVPQACVVIWGVLILLIATLRQHVPTGQNFVFWFSGKKKEVKYN